MDESDTLFVRIQHHLKPGNRKIIRLIVDPLKIRGLVVWLEENCREMDVTLK